MPQENTSSLWISVLIMVALVVVAYVIVKRRGGTGVKGNRSLKVIERLVLGTNRTLLVVKAGEKILLLGMTLQQMTLLTELDAADWQSAIKSQQNSSEGFANILGSFINKSGMDNPLGKFTGSWRS